MRGPWQQAVLEQDKDGDAARQPHHLRDLCPASPPRAAPLQGDLGQGRRPLPQPRRGRARRLRHAADRLLRRPAALPGRRRVCRQGAAGDDGCLGGPGSYPAAEPARADPAQGRRLDRALQAGAPARAGEPPGPQGGPGGAVADDRSARHAQGDRPARRLQRRLPQRHGLREHGPDDPAAAAAAVPLRPGHQHRPQADERRRARRHLQGPPLRAAALHHQGPVAARHHPGGQRHLPRAPPADLGRGHDGLRLRLQEVRRLGPEPDDRVARPLRRPRA